MMLTSHNELAQKLRRLLPALVLLVCAMAASFGVQAQINPEIANCQELKDETTVTQADLCAAHIGCRFVLNMQKTCVRAKSYLERLQTAIGEGTRTLFGYRKEVTPDAVFTATEGDEARDVVRSKLSANPEAQRRAQEISAGVRDVGVRGDTLTDTIGSWVYYGQAKEGKADGLGTRIFSNGDVVRGQYKQGELHGRSDTLFIGSDRFVGDFSDGKRMGPGFYVFKNGATVVATFNGLTEQGTHTRSSGTRFEGTRIGGKRVQGREYRADGALAEEGQFENNELSVGSKYDTAGVRTEVNLPRDREATRQASAEKALQAAEAEKQRKRDEAARAEQQFRASLQTMNPGQLFARADELNAQGDRARAREVQRALMSRFPDHPLAATAARQMAGESGSNPSAGGSSMSAGAAIAASRSAGGRLSSQACEAMKQSIIATKVPPNASVTATMETVMFMTKTVLDMIDGGCPTEPGVTPAQVAAERKERQQQYTTAEQNCNAVQSGGRRCVPQAHTAAAAVSKPPVASAAQSAQQNRTISYDPVTGRCIGDREMCACAPNIGAQGEYGECPSSRRSSGGGIRTAR